MDNETLEYYKTLIRLLRESDMYNWNLRDEIADAFERAVKENVALFSVYDELRTDNHRIRMKLRSHRAVIRGAQNDILHGRPEMDALEEIALSERLMDELLEES